jgi:GGDEF domain-containing protein
MANSTTGNLKYILSTIKSSFLPATFFACALIMFYAANPYSQPFSFALHLAFLLFSALGLALLIVVNQSKPFFSFLIGVISYLGLNWLKIHNQETYLISAEYQCLCFVLPINLAFFYFLPLGKLRRPHCKYILLFILAQMALIQHFGSLITNIPYINITIGNMPIWAAMLWILLFFPISIDISLRNTIINTGMFYADSALFTGLIYADSPSGLTTFFLAFALILCCTTILDLYHRYRYDSLEYVESYYSFLSQASEKSHNYSKFSYKYTLGMFSIDNRDKLLKVIGPHKMQILEQMIINKIRELPYDMLFYRYNEDELFIIFKNEIAKNAQEYADNIRHIIASSEFIFNNGKALKITISICISEKIRKDFVPSDITTRVHNMLQKTHRFNYNITMKV